MKKNNNCFLCYLSRHLACAIVIIYVKLRPIKIHLLWFRWTHCMPSIRSYGEYFFFCFFVWNKIQLCGNFKKVSNIEYAECSLTFSPVYNATDGEQSKKKKKHRKGVFGFEPKSFLFYFRRLKHTHTIARKMQSIYCHSNESYPSAINIIFINSSIPRCTC